jgi:hypothetical protein
MQGFLTGLNPRVVPSLGDLPPRLPTLTAFASSSATAVLAPPGSATRLVVPPRPVPAIDTVSSAGPDRVPPPEQAAARLGPFGVIGLLLATTLVGGLLLAASMDVARGHQRPPLTAYGLFWAGFALVFGTAGLIAWRRNDRLVAPRLSRLAAVGSVAVWGALPRLLVGPVPLYFNDEFAQIWQTQRLVQTGHLPAFNPLNVVLAPSFPGLSYLTYALHLVIPVGVPSIGIAVVLIAHGLGLFGIYLLARAVGLGSRGSAIAAVCYAVNPSWLFFDAMYSYESLAIPLLIWMLAALAYSARHDARRGWRVAVLVLAPAVIATHHATGAFMTVIVLAAAVVAVVRLRRGGSPSNESWAWPVGVAGYTVALFLVWWGLHLHVILDYYSSYVQADRGGVRTVAEGSVLPLFERAALWIQPFAVLAVTVWAWRRLRGTWHLASSMRWTLALLGSLFFVSLPLVFTADGQEAAHRSWATSWIGLAVLVAAAVEVVPRTVTGSGIPAGSRGASSLSGRLQSTMGRHGSLVAVGVGLVVAVIVVGSMAASPMNPYLRFPGTPVVGEQGRIDTGAANNLAAYISANPGGRFFADRYVAGWIADHGNETRVLSTITSARATELVLGSTMPTPAQVARWETSDLRYVIVDRRIGTDKPFQLWWYQVGEPTVALGTHPWGMRALACAPWSTLVHTAGPYQVYRIDLGALASAATTYSDHGRHLPAYPECL